MIEISNKKLEVNNPNLLDSKLAVFIIEFDYDNRVYVGHAAIHTVRRELRKFINDALDESVRKSVLLKESMQNSDILYVTIKEPESYSLDSLFKLKYDLILSCGSYEPFGFNKLISIGNRCEEDKKYMKKICIELKGIYKPVPMSTKARSIKEYEFVKVNKEYKLKAEWPSIAAAAKHYDISASNIAACCTGRLNTAYGRLWRYSD